MDEWFTPPFRLRLYSCKARSGTEISIYYQLAVGAKCASLSTTEMVVLGTRDSLLGGIREDEAGMDDVRSSVGRYV